MILFSQLESITGGKMLQLFHDSEIVSLHTDSRKAIGAEAALFFAIRGIHHDGHTFVKTLYDQGVRQFVVEQTPADLQGLTEANILLVPSSVDALQALATY